MTLPLVLTSGTVSAALEGALWGIPALALSMALPRAAFESVKSGNGKLEGTVAQAVKTAARKATQLAGSIVGETNTEVRVHNVNFPFEVTESTPTERTSVGALALGCIFAEHAPEQYRFRFPPQANQAETDPQSDMACLKRGHISHSIISYASLGRLGHPSAV